MSTQAAVPVRPSSALLRRQLGDYRLLRLVGHGGMASVYAAQRDRSGGFTRRLAVKILHPHMAEDPHFRRMFLDEARIVAAIQHPNVVQVFDVGEDAGAAYLVMELLRGQSLSSLLRRAAGELELGLILHVLAEAAEGVHAAHEARDASGESLDVVHRDVSPQNIHVGYDGQVKVVDFGIAAANDRLTSTRGQEVKGKLGYMAPEQLDGRVTVDRRTDVWALGVVAWQAICGEPLFRGDSDGRTVWNVLNLEAPDLAERLPGLPVAVADCVLRCLERDVRNRPPSAGSVAAVFRAAAQEVGGGDRQLLAARMEGLFVAERAEEETALESPHLRSHTPADEVPTLPNIVRSEAATLAALPAPRYGRGPKRVVAAGVIALGGAAILALSLSVSEPLRVVDSGPATSDHSAELGPTRSRAAEAVPDALAVRVDEPRRILALPVAAGVRLVLVDGVRHSERPVEVTLGPAGVAEVVLVGRDREESVTVGPESAGQLLRLSMRRRHRPIRRTSPGADTPPATMDARVGAGASSEDDGLMDVPL